MNTSTVTTATAAADTVRTDLTAAIHEAFLAVHNHTYWLILCRAANELRDDEPGNYCVEPAEEYIEQYEQEVRKMSPAVVGILTAHGIEAVTDHSAECEFGVSTYAGRVKAYGEWVNIEICSNVYGIALEIDSIVSGWVKAAMQALELAPANPKPAPSVDAVDQDDDF